MSKFEYLVVNGILSNPSDINGWTDRFENLYQNEGFPCTRYEYCSGALTRWMFQGRRVEELNQVIKRITEPVIYVGHSNGCELFGQLLKRTNIKFQAAHLFAPAMDCDFNENGLTFGLLSERVKQIYLYCSTKDQALKNWAARTTWLKFIGLGYGTLGYTGPKNVLKSVQHRVDVTWSNKYDHSDWFKEKNIKKSFDLTIRT